MDLPGSLGPRLNRPACPTVGADVPSRSRTDDELLRQLYEAHGAALLGFARRLTAGDDALAQDIVQETLLRAWRHPEALEQSRGAVRPWLYTVARRLAVDAHRARSVRPHEVGDDALRSVAAPDAIDRAVESWVVAEAIASLRPAHREVLVETYYRGASVREAADRLGIPVGTVKSRAYYALRQLRLLLEEQGIVR